MSSELISSAQNLAPSSVAKPHFIEIDSLRALGCIAVTTYHIIWKFNEIAGSGFWLYKLLGGRGDGFQGFLVFFIISGYVIPKSIRGERLEAVRRFVLSRFFRLYPPFWLVLVSGSLFTYGTLYDKRFWWGLTMIPDAVGVELVLGHFWALEVTMLFNGAVAVLYLFFGRLSLRIIFPIYLISLSLSFSQSALLVSLGIWPKLPLLLSLLFFGACLREVVEWERGQRKARSRVNLSRCLGTGGVSGLMIIVPLYRMLWGINSGNLGVFREFSFLLLWVMLFLFAVILLPGKLSFLSRLGQASYSIYIWHMLIIYIVIAGIKSGSMNILAGWPLPVYVLVFSGLCLSFGWLAHRWIEQPVGRLGKLIMRREIRR